jgi:hypothetical protein
VFGVSAALLYGMEMVEKGGGARGEVGWGMGKGKGREIEPCT